MFNWAQRINKIKKTYFLYGSCMVLSMDLHLNYVLQADDRVRVVDEEKALCPVWLAARTDRAYKKKSVVASSFFL